MTSTQSLSTVLAGSIAGYFNTNMLSSAPTLTSTLSSLTVTFASLYIGKNNLKTYTVSVFSGLLVNKAKNTLSQFLHHSVNQIENITTISKVIFLGFTSSFLAIGSTAYSKNYRLNPLLVITMSPLAYNLLLNTIFESNSASNYIISNTASYVSLVAISMYGIVNQ